MKLAGILFLFLSSMSVWSTVTVGLVDCPTQFEGRVKEIIEEVGPSNPLSTQKIIFQNQASLKGDAPEVVTLDVLKHGPFSIEPGEDYLVQMREEKLCWIEKI